MKSSRDEEARDEEFFKINSTVQNESSSSIAKSLNTALEDSSNISYETKQKETFNNSDLHLFVGNLSKVTDEESLTKYFSNFGKIVDVHVPKNPDNENRAFGYITFANFFKESPMNQLHKIDGS